MPRTPRKQSPTGIHHIVSRGIRKEEIFLDEHDRRYYLSVLARVKEEVGLTLYGFCLMNNHVHLLLREESETIGQIMRRINTAYAVTFNTKYERSGYLFQNRFHSEPVADDAYFLTALRYIHQNPSKAGIVSHCIEYSWSSYRDYTGKYKPTGLIDTAFPLDLHGGRQRFLDFTNAPNNDECLDPNDTDFIRDEFIRGCVSYFLADGGHSEINQLSVPERNEMLRQLKAIEGASLRQIARVVGVSKNIVERA